MLIYAGFSSREEMGFASLSPVHNEAGKEEGLQEVRSTVNHLRVFELSISDIQNINALMLAAQ